MDSRQDNHDKHALECFHQASLSLLFFSHISKTKLNYMYQILDSLTGVNAIGRTSLRRAKGDLLLRFRDINNWPLNKGWSLNRWMLNPLTPGTLCQNCAFLTFWWFLDWISAKLSFSLVENAFATRQLAVLATTIAF